MADDRGRYAVFVTFIILSVLIIFLFTRRHNKRLRRTIAQELPVSRPPPVPLDRAGNRASESARWSQDNVVFLAPSGGNNGSVFIALPQQAHVGTQNTRGAWGAEIGSGRQGRSLPGIYFMEGTRIRFAGQDSAHDDLPRYEEPPPGYDKVIEEGGTASNAERQNNSSPAMNSTVTQASSSRAVEGGSSTAGTHNAATTLTAPSAPQSSSMVGESSTSTSQAAREEPVNTTGHNNDPGTSHPTSLAR